MHRLGRRVELIVHAKRHAAAPVRSVHGIRLVAQNLRHEGVEEGGCVGDLPAFGGGRRESEAGQRGHDDVECLAGVAEHELVDKVCHFQEQAWPAVQQDQGNGVWILGLFMDEMNILRSDLNREVVISASESVP